MVREKTNAERRLELIQDALEAARDLAPEDVVAELEAKRDQLVTDGGKPTDDTDRDADLRTDGGQSTADGFQWDHEDCPRDDCDGELQQQDEFNVLCLSCEGVWTHWTDESDHVLVTETQETVARKPRVATDGGQSVDGTEWEYGDPVVGPSVPKNVREGGATQPMLKLELSGNGTAYEGHSVAFECTECGTVRRFVTPAFMTMYRCDECEDVCWFEFQWDLNRTRDTDTDRSGGER